MDSAPSGFIDPVELLSGVTSWPRWVPLFGAVLHHSSVCSIPPVHDLSFYNKNTPCAAFVSMAPGLATCQARLFVAQDFPGFLQICWSDMRVGSMVNDALCSDLGFGHSFYPRLLKRLKFRPWV